MHAFLGVGKAIGAGAVGVKRPAVNVIMPILHVVFVRGGGVRRGDSGVYVAVRAQH